MSEISEQLGAVDILKDPFMKDKVNSLFIHASSGILSKEWTYSGTIEFRNGDTGGTQKFEAEDLSSLIRKMERFVATLDKDQG